MLPIPLQTFPEPLQPLPTPPARRPRNIPSSATISRMCSAKPGTPRPHLGVTVLLLHCRHRERQQARDSKFLSLGSNKNLGSCRPSCQKPDLQEINTLCTLKGCVTQAVGLGHGAASAYLGHLQQLQIQCCPWGALQSHRDVQHPGVTCRAGLVGAARAVKRQQAAFVPLQISAPIASLHACCMNRRHFLTGRSSCKPETLQHKGYGSDTINQAWLWGRREASGDCALG